MSIKISLVDNDFVVRAETDLNLNEKDDLFRRFLNEIDQELVTGKTAYLEIEDPKARSITLEVSKFNT